MYECGWVLVLLRATIYMYRRELSGKPLFAKANWAHLGVLYRNTKMMAIGKVQFVSSVSIISFFLSCAINS